MGRHRSRFTDRPRNVEISTKDAATYFFYVFPDGRRATLGRNRADAYAKAEALNAHFSAQGLDLAQLIKPKAPRSSPSNPLIPALIDLFREQHLARKTYAQQTRTDMEFRLRRYSQEWESRPVASIPTLDCARMVDQFAVTAQPKHRALLLTLFQFAAHRGYIDTNPAALTMAAISQPKRRRRHTLEGVQAILAASPDWLGRAIRLGLYTLQRRDDLVSIKVDQVNRDEGTITVLQRKTQNYRNPVYIEIAMGQELALVVNECIDDPVSGSHLLRTRPKRMTAQARRAKPHPFAVNPDHLSRSFTELRDAVGAYDQYPREERPTFHELRALGVHLYTQAGYSKDYVMALSGHASEAMFEHYERDHASKKPRLVEAGLGALFPEDTRKIPGNSEQ